MGPIATFEGAFIAARDGQNATLETTTPWRCRVCDSLNQVDSNSLAPLDAHKCQFCKRPRNPTWLQLPNTVPQSPPQSIQCGTRLVVSEADAVFVGVVTEINFLTRHLRLTVISKSMRYDLSKATAQRFEFKSLDVLLQSALQIQLLESESPFHQALDKFAICGECRQVFALSHPFAFAPNQRETTLCAAENAIHQLRSDIQLLDAKKQTLQQTKAYDQVRNATNELKQKRHELAQAQHTLHCLSTADCPFCGWSTSST